MGDDAPQSELALPNHIQGPGWHLDAVFGPDGELQLFDIYVENQWIGSRRTEKLCMEALRNIGATMDKQPEQATGAALKELIDAFDKATQDAVAISESRIGVDHTGRQNIALFIFAKLI